MKPSVVLVMLFLATRVAQAGIDPRVDWINDELIVRGDLFRAAQVAYEDFAEKLRRNAREASDPKAAPSTKELAQYLSTIDHYTIKVAAGPTRYIVWIAPRANRDFTVIFGGDATYVPGRRNVQGS